MPLIWIIFYTLQRTAQEEIGINFLNHLEIQNTDQKDFPDKKGRNNYLRIYAIRIDANCFVITGGAIKFHHLNMERKHTALEMKKLEKCRDFLQPHGIWDVNSFFELINDAL